MSQSFAAPSATFTEIAVIRWLRDLIGYANPAAGDVTTVWDVGGVTTYGGAGSNTTAMMLARENIAPGTMHQGVTDATRMHIVVPAGIGHYSVKSALEWIGCGGRIIEVPTTGYRYDLATLERTLRERRSEIMAVVAYPGDSRTHTVENLRAVHDVTRAIDPRIWLHADACWGLMCAFAPELAHKIAGIEDFDSVTVDPHKVMDPLRDVRAPGPRPRVAAADLLVLGPDHAGGLRVRPGHAVYRHQGVVLGQALGDDARPRPPRARGPHAPPPHHHENLHRSCRRQPPPAAPERPPPT
ncbi:pyridoxal-dependent decarboxylase [Streptomyces sp. NPDC048266]|uniref:pyridoxal-dependent decarboxylase n=1 Tax=Streptomyces sp. NPDC048266 TaxID=3155787 RepID=UPI00340CEF9C